MSYQTALTKAWHELSKASDLGQLKVRFLADVYEIDQNTKTIISLDTKKPVSDFISILLLHYVVKKVIGIAEPVGSWINFASLCGGKEYLAAFEKRALEPVARKFGQCPEGIFQAIDKFKARKSEFGQAGVIIEVFDKVPVMVNVWAQDEEFSAKANMLFDEGISKIFVTEDIAVLSGIIASSLSKCP